MKAHELKKLLDRYAKGECNDQERKFVHDWYDAIGKNIEEALTEELETGRLKLRSQEARIWSRIDPRARPGKGLGFAVRIAATVLLLVLAGTGYFLFDASVMNEPGHSSSQYGNAAHGDHQMRIINNQPFPREVALEDGSTVTLEPLSEIRFEKQFGRKKREVFLSGEAFFNVSRDPSRPFLVYSNEVVTKVLGTSFSIKAYANDKEISVAVSSGRVSVYTNPELQRSKKSAVRQEVILTPNQRVVYNRENDFVSKQLVEKPEIILSKPTIFEMDFSAVEVARIFEALEENYGVDIVYDRELLKNCMLTTSMSDEGFYERIEIICMALNAEYQIKEATVVITGPGCN